MKSINTKPFWSKAQCSVEKPVLTQLPIQKALQKVAQSAVDWNTRWEHACTILTSRNGYKLAMGTFSRHERILDALSQPHSLLVTNVTAFISSH